MKTIQKISLLSLLLSVALFGCKKKEVDAHIPPNVVWNTAAGFTATEAITVQQGDTLQVGIIATKTEDDLKSFNVSYAYDGASTTTSFFNYLLSDTEYNSYSKNLEIVMRNQAGSEKWIFSIVDRDGNITQKVLVCTVE